MWTRKELKDNAKEALKRNYWKAVLVSLLVIAVSGGLNFAFSSSGSSGNKKIQEEVEVVVPVVEDFKSESAKEGMGDKKDKTGMSSESVVVTVGEAVEDALQNTLDDMELRTSVFIATLIVFLVVFIIAIAVFIVVDVFLVNPLCVGAQRFMLKSVDGTGNVGELGFAFDHSYLNNVKVSFYRDLYVFLWTLLFIIPGIYKKYQYYMVDYILAENPDMPYQEVLNRSKEMMDGQKWKTFVLDLSFIFWHMLAMFTCGITEIFYVRPYKNLTRASLYRALCRND